METKKPSLTKNIINVIVLLALIGLTFYIILHNSDGFSLASVGQFIADIHYPFLIGAFLCMIMNIGFKALSLGVLSKTLGYRKGILKNYSYASADIYFSAITPSATGGQPASAYYMVKDGIPISHTTAILSVNLLMYTASLIVLAVITFILTEDMRLPMVMTDRWTLLMVVFFAAALALAWFTRHRRSEEESAASAA